MKLFIILVFFWMLIVNVLLLFSKRWRKERIDSLIKHDKEMKNFWINFLKDIKKLLNK